MAAPNPERRIFPGSGLLPKVFIVYPHNPDSYEQIDPTIGEETIQRNPGVPLAELEERMRTHILEHERKREEKIQQHKQLVRDFAAFIDQSGVAVAYDGLLRDVGSENVMKWCQEQIEDSDYVILIVTDSFKEFLENEVPPADEHIFVGDFLYNFVHSHAKKLLPVFLNRTKDTEILPVALHMCKFYEIWTPCDVRTQRRDDLQSLYSLLTNQSQAQAPPSQGPIQLPKKKRVGGNRPSAGQANTMMTQLHHQMFSVLCTMQPQLLNEDNFAIISDKRDISTHWKQLAIHLGLTEAEVERCEGRGRGDTSEMCLQMLIAWKNKCAPSAPSLAVLADAVYNKYRNVTVFENLCRLYNLC